MFLLTVRDLQYRSLRFLISVAGTALVLSMVFLMTGLSARFRNEPRATVNGFAADWWLVTEGVSGPFTGGAPFPEATADAVTSSDGTRADPVLVARHTLLRDSEPLDVVVIGYRQGGLGEPSLAAGRLPQGASDVVVDAAAGHAVGDRAEIGTRTYQVTGLTRDTTLFAGMPIVAMPLSAAQDLAAGGQPVATVILVRGDLTAVPPGFTQLSPEDVWRDALRPVARSTGAIDLVQALLWIVAATIIGAVVYLSALDRIRDFAVLKAMGTTTRSLLVGLAAQSVLVALVAAVVAMGLQALLRPLFPLPVEVPAAAFAYLPLVAVAVALLASIGGLRRAVRVDPALAFSGAGR